MYARPGHPAAIDLDLLSREAKVAWTEARETDGSKDVLLLREDDARAVRTPDLEIPLILTILDCRCCHVPRAGGRVRACVPPGRRGDEA